MTEPTDESAQGLVTATSATLGDEPRNLERLFPRAPVLTAFLALVAFAAILIAYALSLDEALQVQSIEAQIEAWGSLGAVVSIALMVLHSFVPFPAEFIAIANGMLFGPVMGVAVTWIGGMLGALAAFGLARWLGRPFVARMIRAKDWERLDDWTADEGWKLLLISRFIPVIAFNLINYAAGLTRVSWFTFIWTTAVGILPATILMVLVGDNMALMTWEVWLILGGAGLALWILVRRRMPWPDSVPTRNDEQQVRD